MRRSRLVSIVILSWICISCIFALLTITNDKNASFSNRRQGPFKIPSFKDSLKRGTKQVMNPLKPEADKRRVPVQDVDFNGELPQVRAPGDAGNQRALGEMGKPVNIDPKTLNATEKKKYDRLWNENAYNGYASDLISLHRQLPDMRDIECRQLKYDSSTLPTTSVIIIFHNEGRSALLRTIHSVIDNSPPRLLKEIILVDDCSTRDYLKSPLDDYISALKKVRIVRLEKRQGLIRARLEGADVALGEVLIFLDSHCEKIVGFDDTTLTVSNTLIEGIQVGGFSWNLIFNWHPVPQSDRLPNRTHGIKTPTMAGGLFAIGRQWFNHLGRYDEDMNVWGGENMEISFKVWLCGGQLLTSPCSHVGHIFRKRSPYDWPSTTNVILHNTMRVAKVWLGDFYKYYLEKVGAENDKVSIHGDLTKRIALRDSLHCRDFDWYRTFIYPDLFVPDTSLRSGEIRNEADPYCLDAPAKTSNEIIVTYACHGLSGNQLWYYTKNNEIRRDDMCMDYAGGLSGVGKENKITTYNCHGGRGNQDWTFKSIGETSGMITHVTGLCLTMRKGSYKLIMEKCDLSNPRHRWIWKERRVEN